MAHPKRHGGHILPEQVAFPPAHPLASSPYGRSNPYGNTNPYFQQPQESRVASGQLSGTATPVPPRKKLHKRHGGSLEPQDDYTEDPVVATDAISMTSMKSRTPSHKSARQKRHGAPMMPESDLSSVSPLPPVQHDVDYSPTPSYATHEHGFKKETTQAYVYPVTPSDSVQSGQPFYAPPPPLPHSRPAEQRKLHQIGYRNIWNPSSFFRWHKSVHFHKRANLKYARSAHAQTHYRHHDAAGRVFEGIDEERFILSDDVHLARMLVQAADSIYEDDSSATWRRTFIRNKAPWMIRLANWPVNTVPSSRKDWTTQDWTRVILIWPLACFGLSVAVLGPTYSKYPPEMKYPALVYKYWGYAKVSRNALEGENRQSAKCMSTDATNPISERPLNPRCLWIQEAASKSWVKVVVDEWLGSSDGSIPFSFILVAYTASQFDHDSQSDINALHQIARRAAADAGIEAYWCADSCMSTKDDEMEQDVYRISDVIRAAHSLAIALKQPNIASRTHSDDSVLKEWGSRMWTLPEALLGPKDQPVRIYRHHGGSTALVRTADRRQLPLMLWEDAPLTRQLVDHSEGNITLSRLELVILALKALSARSTSPYLKGDLAYILMGLLRRRPHVDSTDSQFHAFARLSLANDSDRLLERLFSVQPVTQDQPWYLTDDAYKPSPSQSGFSALGSTAFCSAARRGTLRQSMIYGFSSGRLKRSVAGSNISRHHRNEYGECIGEDPINDPLVEEKVQRAKKFGDMRVFTLVDTRHGIVTMFEAVKPPSATLFCAQEGGMQRAVMVSLDWKTSTLYRETVLRMPTLMIQDCWRVDRVRVGFRRPVEDVVPKLDA